MCARLKTVGEMICVVSDEQRKEILGKLSSILRAMKTCSSIKEVEEITGIPSSTIQRYLSREDYFKELEVVKHLKKDTDFKRQKMENLMAIQNNL